MSEYIISGQLRDQLLDIMKNAAQNSPDKQTQRAFLILGTELNNAKKIQVA